MLTTKEKAKTHLLKIGPPRNEKMDAGRYSIIFRYAFPKSSINITTNNYANLKIDTFLFITDEEEDVEEKNCIITKSITAYNSIQPIPGSSNTIQPIDACIDEKQSVS